jgi:hypothetical protein
MRTDRDPTYLILIEQAKEAVAEHGQFIKHDVIHKAGLGKYESLIDENLQWPVVRDRVADESGAMIGIAADNDGGWDPEIHPEKFLPGGRRHTIGYALASTYPKVSQEYFRRRVAQVGGQCRSLDKQAISFQQQGVSIAYTPGTAPLLAPPAAAAE